jgi:hypothetical protein
MCCVCKSPDCDCHALGVKYQYFGEGSRKNYRSQQKSDHKFTFYKYEIYHPKVNIIGNVLGNRKKYSKKFLSQLTIRVMIEKSIRPFMIQKVAFYFFLNQNIQKMPNY